MRASGRALERSGPFPATYGV